LPVTPNRKRFPPLARVADEIEGLRELLTTGLHPDFQFQPLVGALSTWNLWGALQLGLSWLFWGVVVRTIAVWHITWAVNSIAHLWGYRTFDAQDESRNNWLVGLVSNGEGWHNNHHAEPRCAAHGQRWWELDVSYLTIRALELVGLATDVVKPRRCRMSDHSDEPHAIP
jgi:stearoyl-CoA desaturase (delta-9 desaturase)